MKSDLTSATRVCGIDLGASSIWIVLLEGTTQPHVSAVERLPASALDRVGEFVSNCSCVAIDAPGGLSAGCHLGDDRVATKFQSARCSEVALRRAGIAVPFVTPIPTAVIPTWMAVGFSVWDVARDSPASVVETYPHGIFWRLAGRQLLHKQREEGRDARRSVLRPHIVFPVGVQFWGHDALDALACAWLAWCVIREDAEEISCARDLEWPRHDGSSIWLPVAAAPTPSSLDPRPN